MLIGWWYFDLAFWKRRAYVGKFYGEGILSIVSKLILCTDKCVAISLMLIVSYKLIWDSLIKFSFIHKGNKTWKWQVKITDARRQNIKRHHLLPMSYLHLGTENGVRQCWIYSYIFKRTQYEIFTTFILKIIILTSNVMWIKYMYFIHSSLKTQFFNLFLCIVRKCYDIVTEHHLFYSLWLGPKLKPALGLTSFSWHSREKETQPVLLQPTEYLYC